MGSWGHKRVWAPGGGGGGGGIGGYGLLGGGGYGLLGHRGVRGMLPQEFLKFTCSEVASGAPKN